MPDVQVSLRSTDGKSAFRLFGSTTRITEVTARAAVNEFFARFGFPFNIFTDQGRNFESKLFKFICEVLQIHKCRTTPYRPSANGQVERFNRTIMKTSQAHAKRDYDVKLYTRAYKEGDLVNVLDTAKVKGR